MVKSFLDSECVDSSTIFLTRLVAIFSQKIQHPCFFIIALNFLSACPTGPQTIVSSINLLIHLPVCPMATRHKNSVIFFFLCKVPFYTLNCSMVSNLNAIHNLPSSHSEMLAPSTTLVFVHSIILSQESCHTDFYLIFKCFYLFCENFIQ